MQRSEAHVRMTNGFLEVMITCRLARARPVFRMCRECERVYMELPVAVRLLLENVRARVPCTRRTERRRLVLLIYCLDTDQAAQRWCWCVEWGRWEVGNRTR